MCRIVRKSVEKKHLYEIVRISVEKNGNVRKFDLVEIRFQLSSQLDPNCSENVENDCKKLLVELKYKTKDNLKPNKSIREEA